MSVKFLMGNEAIALGAVNAGVNLVCGYPGTPSTEVLETVAKNNNGNIYVEWSINEKAALEVGAGASYAGARVLVTMKQVGLNVASDPLMSLTYVGIKGGMVILVADDPGPISSQTEQDTRHFGEYAKLPVFDPSSPEEAYSMIKDAFELSEKYGTPVLFRPTTRVCHGYATVEVSDSPAVNKPEGFVKDSSRWVIFPRLAFANHKKIENNLIQMSDEFSEYKNNIIKNGSQSKGIVTGGISYEYVCEALEAENISDIRVLKISTPHPFPEKLALDFINGLDEVLAVEELDPVLEKALIFICGKYNIKLTFKGKLSGDMPNAGENSVETARAVICKFLGRESSYSENSQLPTLPVRPPVLCAGCPHRASFYAVKQAVKGRKAVFCGDIGCYTLGNAMPLDMVDTCLCMGADVTMAQGLHRIEPDTISFSFIGDSTFFASGMTGVVNAVYNQTDIVLIVLDNSTTAMTGHQPHPGTGLTMMGDISEKVSIEKILTAIGVSFIKTANPLNLDEAVSTIREAVDKKGVRAIIFKSPCIAIIKSTAQMTVDTDKCIGCKKCIKELGCPAIVLDGGKAKIEESLCTGCSLCSQVCPVSAIIKKGGNN